MDHLTCLCFSPPLNLLAFSSSLPFFLLLPSSIHPSLLPHCQAKRVELFICHANNIWGREWAWIIKWLCAQCVVSSVATSNHYCEVMLPLCLVYPYMLWNTRLCQYLAVAVLQKHIRTTWLHVATVMSTETWDEWRLFTLGNLSWSPGCLGMTFCNLWKP